MRAEHMDMDIGSRPEVDDDFRWKRTLPSCIYALDIWANGIESPYIEKEKCSWKLSVIPWHVKNVQMRKGRRWKWSKNRTKMCWCLYSYGWRMALALLTLLCSLRCTPMRISYWGIAEIVLDFKTTLELAQKRKGGWIQLALFLAKPAALYYI